MNIAIILAGGSGTRFGANMPKQFVEINGRYVIEYSIEAFEKNDNIDEIAIVCKSDFIDLMNEIILKRGFKKVKKVLEGGNERYESSMAAIREYVNDSDNLIFHDAVRPLVSDDIINVCVAALKIHNAIDVAIKTTDTIIQIDDNGFIKSVPDRAYLMNGQTPQCFKRGVIAKAYEVALKDPGFKTTDDCGVVLRYLPNEPIYVVSGAVANMKLTHPEDALLIEKLLDSRSK